MNGNARTALFIEMLITLIEGGATLVDALRVLCGAGIPETVRRSAMAVLESMGNGNTLSSAFAKTTDVPRTGMNFSATHLSLISSAEATGALAPILRDIRDDFVRRNKAREAFLSALIYPASVIAIAFIGSVILYAKGLPLFLRNGMISDDVIGLASRGVVVGGAFLLFAGSSLLFAFNRIFNRESREYTIFHTLSFLMGRGIPLSDALGQCVSNLRGMNEARALFTVRKCVEEGIPLSEAFARTGDFTPFVTGWLALADDTGNAVEIFENLAEYYREKDGRLRETATRMVEPAIIAIAGIYLLILIQSVVMPILTLSGGFNA